MSAGNDSIAILLLILAVLAQPAGAFFLKDSLQAYFRDKSRKPAGKMGSLFFITVIILHLVFFGILSLDIIFELGFDFGSSFDNNPFYIDIPVGVLLFIALTFPTIATCFFIIPSRSKRIHRPSLWKIFLGEFIISFSAFVFISAYWDNLFGFLGGEISSEPFGFKTFFVFMFFLLFLMIYLPPRLVFLVTDYNSWFTWLRIFFVYLPFIAAAY